MATKLDVIEGKKPISWKRLMALKPVGNDTFESLTAAWPPAPFKRTFGGHVYAQAVYAASKTVGEGLVVHQVTGYFILPGGIDTPFVYRIRRIRDGGIYCLRGVDVYQQSEAAASGTVPCFVATVSFKRSEKASRKWKDFEHQSIPNDHVQKTYRSVLEGKRCEDHPLAPGADALWWEQQEKEEWEREAAAFPGVECRKVDMKRYNFSNDGRTNEDENSDITSRWRQLLFYRLIQDDDSNVNDPVDLNLHAAAHLYASDRNSLFLIQRAAGYQDVRTTMASLSHTVVFHGLAEHLCMVDDSGKSKWFVQEAWTSGSGDKRGTHNSRLWDYEAGRVLATTLQDGMLRFPAVEPVEGKSGAVDESDGKRQKGSKL